MTSKKIFIILISFIIFISACDSPTANADNEFEKTSDYITETLLASNTLDLHFCLADTLEFDANTTQISLGNIFSDEQNTDNNFFNEILDMLATIDKSQLSEENAYAYEIIYTYAQNQNELSKHPYKYEPLSAFSGQHVQLPLLLAEFPFHGTGDIEIYFKLLYDLPRYFEEILRFEEEKLTANEFMSENCFNSLITFCTEFPGENISEHFLVKAFENKLNDVYIDEALKASYIQEHLNILKSEVFPAYENLKNKMTELSANASFNNTGLCSLSSGKEYYEALVQAKTGDNRALTDIGDEMKQQLSFLSTELKAALQDNSSLIKTLMTGSLDSYIAGKDTLAKSKEYLDKLYTLSCDAFGNEAKKLYFTEYIEPHLSPYFSSAFFLLPPIDDFSSPTIYINPDTQFTSFDLFTTLAHEGYPGHLQQTITQKDDLLSRLFSCLGYCEGWASYCELYTYPLAVEYLKLGEADQYENTARSLKLYRELTLCIYALLDYNIHYNYWSADDAYSFLSDYGITDSETTENIYNYIVNEPANYMTYYVGYINVVNLKEEYIAQGHTEVEFHEAFLECGEAPFEIVREKLLAE